MYDGIISPPSKVRCSTGYLVYKIHGRIVFRISINPVRRNTSIYNSDGVQAFATGAFAPGVTLQDATYKLLAVDGGIKWNGLAVNGQYFMRWLGDFVADGPLPLASTFDHGGELSAGYFVKPKKLMPYVRTSWVRGQFGNSYEYGAGLKWHFRPERAAMVQHKEVFRINKAPYSGAFLLPIPQEYDGLGSDGAGAPGVLTNISFPRRFSALPGF